MRDNTPALRFAVLLCCLAPICGVSAYLVWMAINPPPLFATMPESSVQGGSIFAKAD